jgi:hypothetical protein
MIDIKGKSKADVLAALYNASKPQGMGILHFNPTPWSEQDAQTFLDANWTPGTPLRFDYLKGRVMKVRLDGDEFNPAMYDRDNGEGAAERALKDVPTAIAA